MGDTHAFPGQLSPITCIFGKMHSSRIVQCWHCYRRYTVAPFLSYPSIANKVWYWLSCVCTLMCDSLQHLGLSFDKEMWFTDHIAVNQIEVVTLLALYVGDVPRRSQPVHISGASSQFTVGEGGSGVKCVQVQKKQHNRARWVARGDKDGYISQIVSMMFLKIHKMKSCGLR